MRIYPLYGHPGNANKHPFDSSNKNAVEKPFLSAQKQAAASRRHRYGTGVTESESYGTRTF